MAEPCYLAIDLKSFYASVECVARGLDPLRTHLVVADKSRTEKTICLAVSPTLKAYGIPGRARLFEVVQRAAAVNAARRAAAGRQLSGSSCDADALRKEPALALDYITAPPRMALYMQTSAQIYQIYLKYIAPEDLHVYSIDEVFIDAAPYLHTGLTPRALAMQIILDVYRTTGITATAGIGTNLYLAKIAMDIEAKHTQPDANGVRIAELDELQYRKTLWQHRPLTDFWRIGHGIAKKLEAKGLSTMGDIVRCSLGKPDEFYNEELLYRMFGVNAELLIDHAWGCEPCTIADIKAYQPQTHSVSSGQVLQCPYVFEKARLVAQEMADALALDLARKGLVTGQLVLTVGYDRESLTDPACPPYHGPVTTDHYGRRVPKAAHGSENFQTPTASSKEFLRALTALFDRIVDRGLLVRRMYVVANRVQREQDVRAEPEYVQLDLFSDETALAVQRAEQAARERERRMQSAVLAIREKYGKNAILKGMSLRDGATARQRNEQIGGHKA